MREGTVREKVEKNVSYHNEDKRRSFHCVHVSSMPNCLRIYEHILHNASRKIEQFSNVISNLVVILGVNIERITVDCDLSVDVVAMLVVDLFDRDSVRSVREFIGTFDTHAV